jgi:hypothetical protein
MKCPFETFRLSGHVTIDATENSFLDKAEARCKALLPNAVEEHKTRNAAVANCRNKAGEVNIVGHGQIGKIGTGCGAALPGAAEVIELTNPGNWDGAHRMTRVTLLGCNTGAGQEGADLLFTIAQMTGIPVRAPVGLVHIGADCDDFYLDPENPHWQVAKKGEIPEPKSATPFPETFRPSVVRLVADGAFTPVRIQDLIWVRYYPREGSPPVHDWRGSDIVDVIRFVDFERPLLRGVPAAFITGTVEIAFSIDGHDVHRTFRIYNDQILQDTVFEQIFYRVNMASIL